MTGKPIENYTKYLDNKEYDFDDTTSSDFYTFARIEYDENNTSYTSYSKQIGIWCPDGDDRVECILFGRAGYYDNLDK